MSGSDPLLDRLADANPTPPRRVQGMSRSPSADRILDQIVGSTPGSVARSGIRRRVLVVASALVVAFAGGALIVRIADRGPETATDLLLRAAIVAAERPAPSGTGAFLYTKVRADDLATFVSDAGTYSVVLPVVRKTWIAADGSGWSRSVTGDHRFLGARDRAAWRSAGRASFASGPSTERLPPGSSADAQTGSLSTRSGELLAALRHEVESEGPPTDVAVFGKVGELLARGDASPTLRASLYRVASGLPGVHLLGDAADPIGRSGVAVSMTYEESGAAVRLVMIFDPESSALLAQERILLERASWVDADPGTTLSWVAYLRSARTDSHPSARSSSRA